MSRVGSASRGSRRACGRRPRSSCSACAAPEGRAGRARAARSRPGRPRRERQRVLGNPRSTLLVVGSGQRLVTTFPCV
jgi:hypothetical protein